MSRHAAPNRCTCRPEIEIMACVVDIDPSDRTEWSVISQCGPIVVTDRVR